MNDGRKKKPQKHKNRTAFKITFDTQALEHQKKVSLNKYIFSYEKVSVPDAHKSCNGNCNTTSTKR